ncbi:MAG: hypothetical protein JWQ12_2117 [Glaciihabitans sp.]|nr:hypothetical protein [Glaciihabitans sp.]
MTAPIRIDAGVPKFFAELPPRLERAILMLRQLEAEGVHFAPIRHHSPTCAQAVASLIAEAAPTTVLIEGPEEYTSLIGELARPETIPPVAILSTAGDSVAHNGFFPLAEFSPEWVALRAGVLANAKVAFIDESWSERKTDPSDDPQQQQLTRTIQAERYLAHSRVLHELARREHCRDHDELWDQLFELRDLVDFPASRTLLDEVFVWSALARLEYETPVLVSEGSITREARMAARIQEYREDAKGPIVVVTGAFHTLALVEALTMAAEGAIVREAVPSGGYQKPADGTGVAWLIRFDNARLDSLSGYGAGMPSPGYYGRVWTAPTGFDPTRDVLLDVAHAVRAANTTDVLGIADVTSAMTSATRLAELRGRPKIGRTDVLDAIRSSFTKGEADSSPALRDALQLVFVGNKLGQVPPDTAAPPVVAEARARAIQAKLTVSDSTTRSASLDLRRKPAHRSPSRYLSLMEFLGTGFATRVGGPDLISGRGLGRLFEDWSYAWTPLVEARLIELSSFGTTLNEIALARIIDVEQSLGQSANSRSASIAVNLLAQAATIGLSEHLPRLTSLVDDVLDADPSLASVVQAALRLLGLWNSKDELEFEDTGSLSQLLDHSVGSIAFLVPSLATTEEARDDEAAELIVELRSLMLRLSEQAGISAGPIERELERVRVDARTSPSVHGALVALAALDGKMEDSQLSDLLLSRLGAGADVERSVRFLVGFMRAAPDLLVRDPIVFTAIEDGVGGLTSDAFLSYLPDLRRAFSWLKPLETAALAERIAGGRAIELTMVRTDLSASDLQEGIALQRALSAELSSDGLAEWAGGDQ